MSACVWGFKTGARVGNLNAEVKLGQVTFNDEEVAVWICDTDSSFFLFRDDVSVRVRV